MKEIKHYCIESKEFQLELTIERYNNSISRTKGYGEGLEIIMPKVW